MTDNTRLAALEAVAEAAANYRKARLNDDPDMIVISKRSQLYNALYALYALPADPARGDVVDVVEVALFGTARGERCLADPSIGFASELLMDCWRRLGTVTLEVKP